MNVVCYADRVDGYNGDTSRVLITLENGKVYENHAHGSHRSAVLDMYIFDNVDTALWYVKRKSEFYSNVMEC